MSEWSAPAKLNLSLEIRSPDASGYHPLRSLVQTIEWCDRLTVEAGDGDDRLVVDGADLPTDDDNLVLRAAHRLVGPTGRPRLEFRLVKHIAVAAGLGGGSADAAASLCGVADLLGVPEERVRETAPGLGSDVPLFLTGGTLLLEGYGEKITPLDRLSGFAVAVAVPDFELATPEVYRAWDRLGGPVGERFPSRGLPPQLRRGDDLRNDLHPAAVSLRPQLADWMADLAGRWERPVAMSGSGPSVYGFFADVEEARAAVEVVTGARAAVGVDLRSGGVAKVDSGR